MQILQVLVGMLIYSLVDNAIQSLVEGCSKLAFLKLNRACKFTLNKFISKLCF